MGTWDIQNGWTNLRCEEKFYELYNEPLRNENLQVIIAKPEEDFFLAKIQQYQSITINNVFIIFQFNS